MRTQVFLLTYAVSVLLPAALSSRAAGPDDRQRARDAADRVRTKVVVLKTARAGGGGAATGFLARPGLVLTVGHAVAEATSITAWVNGVSYHAAVAASHPELDLAALSLRAPGLLLKPVELSAARDLAEGEALVILAGPSQAARATGDPAGRVVIPAAFRRPMTVRAPNGRLCRMLAMDARVERGDSGSPVVRVRDGTVLGMLTSRDLPATDGASHIAYALPLDSARAWLDATVPAAGEEFYLSTLLKKAPR